MSRDAQPGAAAPKPADGHRPPRLNWAAVAAGLAAFVCLSVYTVLTMRGPVEQDLTGRATAALDEAGESWATARFEGRNATILGEALAEEARAKVEGAVAAQFGVRTVTDRTTLLPLRRPFTFSAVKDGKTIAFDGYVPSGYALRRIIAAARALGPDVTVTGQDRLVRARGAPPGDFSALVAFGLQQLARLPSGRITLSDGAIGIEGRAADLDGYAALSTVFQGPLPDGMRLARFAVRPPVAAPFSWVIAREGRQVNVSGFVPSDDARREVLAAIRTALPDARVADEMRLADGAPSTELWLKAVRYAAAQLALMPAGRVALSDTAISVDGAAPNFMDFDALAAARRAPPEGFQVTRFAVEPPRVSPFVWSVERLPETIRLGGFAPSEEARRLLGDAARAAFPGVAVRDEMRLAMGGPPPEVWAGGARFAVTQLARLRAGEARVSGSQVTLTGEALDSAAYAALMAAAQAPPAGISVSAREVKPPLISPYVFAVSRDPAGLTLSGFWPDAATHEAILAFLDRNFLGEKVNDVSVIGSGAPSGFLAAVTAGLTELERLASGELRLTDGQMRLAGETLQPAAAPEIEDDLRRGIGRPFTAEVALNLAPPGAPLESKECQALMRDLLARGTVRFDSGSAVIDRKSYGLLDKLVYVTQRCRSATVEIAGYTDDVGDALANVALSQQRAEAVASYLTQAGVARERLSATGYGATAPVDTNQSEAGRARNRRIEFVVK